MTIKEDEWGNEVEVPDWKLVYANEYSIGSNEYYNAAVNGLRPEESFEIYSFEYNKEKKFKYNDEEYKIIRTQGKGEKIVIIGEKVAGDG
jgi:hypothetical protein